MSTKTDTAAAKKTTAELPAFARMMRATVFACGEEALIEDKAEKADAANKLAAA